MFKTRTALLLINTHHVLILLLCDHGVLIMSNKRSHILCCVSVRQNVKDKMFNTKEGIRLWLNIATEQTQLLRFTKQVWWREAEDE